MAKAISKTYIPLAEARGYLKKPQAEAKGYLKKPQALARGYLMIPQAQLSIEPF
jgi:hypothetical protein